MDVGLEQKNPHKQQGYGFGKNGYLILRYWEREIKGNVQGVIDEIEEVLMMTDNIKVYGVS